MPSVRLCPLAFFLAALPVACGGSSSSLDSDFGMGGSSGTSNAPANLDPSPYVDVTTCSAIHSIESDASTHCSICCDSVDSNESSFINKDTCTCKLPRDDDPAKTVCASSAATGDTCSACCNDNGYLVSGWVGEDELTHTQAQCGCGILQDKTVCAAYTRSEEACTNCCVHEGFISYGYGAQCWCMG